MDIVDVKEDKIVQQKELEPLLQPLHVIHVRYLNWMLVNIIVTWMFLLWCWYGVGVESSRFWCGVGVSVV